MNSHRPFHPILGYHIALAAVLAFSASAAAQTWTAAVNTDWNNAGNWNPATIPNSASADAIFGFTGAGLVNIGSSVQARSLTFGGVSSGAYTLTSSANQTLSGVAVITLNGPISNVQTINLANVAGGSLLVPGTGVGALTIANGAAVTAFTTPRLVIGPNTVIGRSGPGIPGITVTGSGTTEISATILSTMSSGLTVNGPGKLVISGLNTGAGGTTLAGGTLILDYGATASSKLPSGTLTSGGGDLTVLANAATAFSESASSTSLTAGHTAVQLTTNNGALAALTLTLGSITRSPGSTVSVVAQTGAVVTTTLGTINGILGGWATDSAANWLTRSGSNVVPLATYGTDVYSSGTNTDVTVGTGIPTGFTTNSLRFNTFDFEGLTAHLAGTNTVQSGGILLGNSSGDVTITGGTLAAVGAAGELIVHQNNAAANLTINSSITAPGGLTKTGPGTLSLGGNTFFLDGPVNVNRGNLRITTNDALTNLTAVNFNDGRGGAQQRLTVELGDGVNGGSGVSIRLNSAGVDPQATTLANTFANDSPNSRVTLAGIISSPAGAVTTLALKSAATAGFNLTGNNTFTGAVRLSGGFLGIDANASLGNAANTLFLSASNFTDGGLEFLNGGIDVARPVVMGSNTRVLSNGVDVNTISGVISGGGGNLTKAGTGTLVLTAANTFGGSLFIDAGTVRVASAANLGNGTIIGIGGTLAVTDNLTTNRTFLLGPAEGGTGPGMLDVAAGKTLTLTGPINDGIGNNGFGASGILVKTGPGTLVLSNVGNTYTGGTIVHQGTVQAAANSNLGASAGPVTVQPLGTLTFIGSTSTTRTFNLAGTLSVSAGQTLTFDTATVGGGFLRGPGTFALNNGATLTGVTTFGSTTINQTGTATLGNFTNGGTFTNAAGQPLAWNGGTNTSSGQMFVNGTANVSEFVSDGQVTIPNGGVMNNSGAPLVLGGGSRTFIGSAAAPGGAINLGGQTLELNGGLLVNNGTVSGTVNVNFGSVAKGAGQYGVVNVRDGGVYAPGNSPGISTAAAVDFDDTPTIFGGPTLMIELAGIAPGAEYDQLHVTGSLSLGGKLAVSLVNGFAPAEGNSFDILDWGTTSGAFGTINLPTLSGTLTWDTSRLLTTGELIVIPEPGSGALLALGALTFASRRRPATEPAG